MSKYSQQMGDPLDMLVEECAELIQEAMKIKRFGPKGNPTWLAQGNKGPRDNLVQEIGDILAVVGIIIDQGYLEITGYEIEKARETKQLKIKELFDPPHINRALGE